MTNRTNLKISMVIAVLLVGVHCAIAAGDTIYVKDAASGDGTSWAGAFGNLQDGLDAAIGGDEIWVAEGTYKPTSDHGLAIGDRGKHFRMKNGVAIYGGFANAGEPDWTGRDPNIYVTILSGDLCGNDLPVTDPFDLFDEPSRQDNCYQVFYHPSGLALYANAILDGFTITGGNADEGSPPRCFGGGMHNESANPTVTNCTFSGNFSLNGGGMYNKSSNTMLTNCIFSGNSAGSGGGMLNDESNLTLVNCIFSANAAEMAGGMYDHDGNTTLPYFIVICEPRSAVLPHNIQLISVSSLEELSRPPPHAMLELLLKVQLISVVLPS